MSIQPNFPASNPDILNALNTLIEVVAKLSSSPLNNDREIGFVTQRSHQFTLIESKPFESE